MPNAQCQCDAQNAKPKGNAQAQGNAVFSLSIVIVRFALGIEH
jgi:hypothetical protein